VSIEEGQLYSQMARLPFITTSALSSSNIQLLFSQLASVLPLLHQTKANFRMDEDSDPDYYEENYPVDPNDPNHVGFQLELGENQTLPGQSCFEQSHCSIM